MTSEPPRLVLGVTTTALDGKTISIRSEDEDIGVSLSLTLGLIQACPVRSKLALLQEPIDWVERIIAASGASVIHCINADGWQRGCRHSRQNELHQGQEAPRSPKSIAWLRRDPTLPFRRRRRLPCALPSIG